MVVAGTPEDGQTASEPAVSTGVVKAIPGAVADGRFVSVTVPLQPGSSGAPGRAGGQNPEKIELALGAAVIKEFLSG